VNNNLGMICELPRRNFGCYSWFRVEAVNKDKQNRREDCRCNGSDSNPSYLEGKSLAFLHEPTFVLFLACDLHYIQFIIGCVRFTTFVVERCSVDRSKKLSNWFVLSSRGPV
jgi:hypothetical protein